jgi:hypothetical protein
MKRILRTFLLSIFLFFPSMLIAQVGGTRTYAFLELPNSARTASLGGKMVAATDGDLNLAWHNPSLLTEESSNTVVVNYVNYFTDINFGYVSYARSYANLGNFAAGMHYVNYGNFTAADATGIITGQFRAAEYALCLMYSRSIDSNFTAGITLKPIYSSLENYRSFGLAADLGLTYQSTDRLFVASMVIRNIGTQFSGYYSGSRERLPFEIEIGLSQRLSHAPFRFYLTAHQLQKPDLGYTIPGTEGETDPITGNTTEQSKIAEISDLVMRHMIMGIEINPVKSFYFRFGYNYQRRKELQIVAKPAMAGFSWGFGINVSNFTLSYGRASYHLAGASNHFSVNANLSQFYRKKSS